MNSIFDIVGPVMIGPSSSHTAGAARLGKMARYILHDKPVHVRMTLYGSFAKTYKGHGTNKALVAGLLGYEADDARIPTAFEEAQKEGLSYEFVESPLSMGHPNVVRFDMVGEKGNQSSVMGRSLGGGRIMVTDISGLPVEITGETYTLMTLHKDRPGVVAHVTNVLANKHINISSMRVFRNAIHESAVMTIDTDDMVDNKALQEIQENEAIERVMSFKPL